MFFLSAIMGLAILLVVTVVVSVICIVAGEKNIFKSILTSWAILGIVGLFFIIVGFAADYFTRKMTVEREDVYGTYVIDRDQFPGRNADWQYEHYRFEITPPNNFKFYVTNRQVILRTYEGTVSITDYGVITPHFNYPDSSRYHILKQDPTLYRKPFSFYYVFESPLYGNMFFKKGEYKMSE